MTATAAPVTKHPFALGRCGNCGRGVRVVDLLGLGRKIACPDCGTAVKCQTIHGYESAKPCGGSCLNAKRGTCDCSCNGENHGAGWAA